MKLVSKLLLIFFMLGLVSVCLPQEESTVRNRGISAFQINQQKANQGGADAQFTSKKQIKVVQTLNLL
jgi:hypothetical protein